VVADASIQLEPGWLAALALDFKLPYMDSLKQFLSQEKQNGKIIYPKGSEYFAAMNTTPLDKVKVVILGQDPYHGPDQAHGLCFSVRDGVKIPPSLVNIFKEIRSDLNLSDGTLSSGNLTAWAQQGVIRTKRILCLHALGKLCPKKGKRYRHG
jgi:uracil-DNA glycosylase